MRVSFVPLATVLFHLSHSGYTSNPWTLFVLVSLSRDGSSHIQKYKVEGRPGYACRFLHQKREKESGCVCVCVFVCMCVRVVENIVQRRGEGSQVSSTDFVVGGGNHRHDKRHVTMDTEEPPFISYSISLSYSLLPRSSSFVRISYTGASLTTFISQNLFFFSFFLISRC